MIRTSTKRTLAFSAAFGLVFAGGAAGMAPLDVTPVASAKTAGDSQTIPADATGTINIHKYLNPVPADQATGEEMDTTNMGDIVEGVTFSVQKVNGIDITTDEGLKAAAALTPATAKDMDLAAPVTGDTDDAGNVSFPNLPVGVYLVKETEVPAGVVPGNPFLVFLPMTNSDGTGWNYNVHVYPKNSENTASKKVVDANQHVGEDITYTITSDVPALADQSTDIAKYIVRDDLDEKMLSTTKGGVSIALSDGEQMIQGTDYTLTIDQVTQQVEATFTEAGLQKLTVAKKKTPTLQVNTTISATVKKIGDGTGVVKNDATIISNNGGGGGDTTTTTDPVESRWGKVNINKKDGNGAGLEGAIFSVYECTSADALGDVITLPNQDSSPGPDTPGSQFTTGEDGTVVIDGLHATDYQDGASLTSDARYCLVEEQAPEGYAKKREPIPFTLSAAEGTTDEDGNVTKIQYTAEVVNYKDNTLPGTGGMGVWAIILGGLGIAGLGLFAAKRNGKKA